MTKSHEFTSWRLCVLAALVVLLLGVAAPRLSAQINIGAGGFDTTTVCKSSNPTTGCLVQTNGSAQSAVNNQQSNVLRLTTSTGSLTASAWAATPQTVVNGFTSVFTFQFTNPSNPPADGIAFLIQNSSAGLAAIGIQNGNGGSIGYGADDANQQLNQAIPNSLAIEFDTYLNGWDPNANHIAVQTCGTGYNTSHHNLTCSNSGLSSNLGIAQSPVALVDGATHTVTIQYNPPGSPCTTTPPPAPAGTVAGNLCVYIDQTANPNPVLAVVADLSTIGLTNGTTAYVGFTGATGGSYETQDILSWNFAPTVVQPFNPDGTTTSNFNTPAGENQQTFNTATANGALICNTPTGTQDCSMVQLQTTNTTISATDAWKQYVVGTPWAISTCAARPANGGSDTCSLFVNACFGGSVTASNASDIYCPVVNTDLGPDKTITFTDTWDPVTPSPIPAGTTVSLIDFVPQSAAEAWTPSPTGQMTANSVCLNPFGANPSDSYKCDISDALIDMYGDQTTTKGSKPKKGWLISVFEVPMNLTSVNVVGGNGCSSPNSPLNDINTADPNFENPAYAANIWNNGNCLLDFGVYPASVPPSYTGDPTHNYFTPAPSATFIYGKGPLALPDDGTAPNPPNLGTAAFWDTGVNQTLKNYLGPDGSFVIHWSATDNVGIAERNIQLLTAPTTAFLTCPNFNNSDGTPAIPGQPAPCYATSLFTTVVNVDSTLPTISANIQNGTFGINQKVYPTYTCADPLANNVASGISTCGGTSIPLIAGGACQITPSPVASLTALDTSTAGPHNYSTMVKDCAGNTTTTQFSYTVTGPTSDVALFEQPGSATHGTTFNAVFWALDLSSNAASNVTINATLNLPSGVLGSGSVSAVAGIVSCTLAGCNALTTGTTCTVTSNTTVSCSIGNLPSVLKITGAAVKISIPIASSATKNEVHGQRRGHQRQRSQLEEQHGFADVHRQSSLFGEEGRT